MAGHSKWKNIRLHKGKADLERGKVFGKLARELTVAAKLGGGNPDSNPRLRLAVEKARGESMPADNIKRAIQKGTGELASENYDEDTVMEAALEAGAEDLSHAGDTYEITTPPTDLTSVRASLESRGIPVDS